MKREFHKSWLKVSAIVIGSFGPVFFLGAIEATAEPARWTLDLLDLPLDGSQTFSGQTTRFMSALAGGFLLGWGVLVWCLSGAVYDAAPEGVRKALLSGALAWYFLDSAGSVAAGAWTNVFFNLAVLLAVVGPMWRPAIEDRAAEATA